MAIITGVVENTSEKFGKFSVQVDGDWYSTKLEWAKVKPRKGDEIRFDNGASDQYPNSKFLKNVKVLNGGSSEGGTGPAPAPSGGGKRQPEFPVPYDSRGRSILRQNALTNAVNLSVAKINAEDAEIDTQQIISLAMEFESYTSGDMDDAVRKEIENEMAE